MKINQLQVGELSTNCYIVTTEKNNAIVIDAGGSFEAIKKFLEENDITVKAIVLTHGHYDHIEAVNSLKELTNAPLYIHKDDEELIICPEKSLSTHFTDFTNFIPLKADVLLKDGDLITVDDVTLKTVHTTGHTKGSCVFCCDGFMFAGDTLFKNGCGRTDLYGGNMDNMRISMRKLADLEGDYTVLSGHGEQTKLSYERLTNQYMGASYDDIF